MRHPVFVPPPPVIELDEIAPPDLPTVLSAEERDRYRRIFQAQSNRDWATADAEIVKVSDKTLMGYVDAQRLLSPGYTARYYQLATWLQDYNDHPDAPAIYRLAQVRRTPGSGDLTPASFVGTTPGSPTFAAARTVTGADAARAAELRARLQRMVDDSGFNAAFALLDQKETVALLGGPEVELWRGRVRTRALEADLERGMQVPVGISAPPDANWNAGLSAFTSGNMPRPPAALSWWPTRRRTGPRPGPSRQAPSGRPAPTCWPAIRRSSPPISSGPPCTAAPSMAWSPRRCWACRSWPTGTCRRSTASVPTRCATTALAVARWRCSQLGASTAAERELFAASLDAEPQYIETVMAVAQKASLPALSVRVGNAAWDQRDKITGYDGAMYPLPPWQPAAGFSLDKALVYAFMRKESTFRTPRRAPMSVPWA